MTAPSKELAQWMVTQGLTGPFAGLGQWAVHTVSEPDGPGQHPDVITIYDTGTTGDMVDDDADQEAFTFQVRVRASKYADGHAKQVAIRNALVRAASITSGSVYNVIEPTSGILPLGPDASQRQILTANYRAIRTV